MINQTSICILITGLIALLNSCAGPGKQTTAKAVPEIATHGPAPIQVVTPSQIPDDSNDSVTGLICTLGYFISSRLPSANMEGPLTPKSNLKEFLVVVLELPIERVMVSEEEYNRFKSQFDDPASQPSRSSIRIYDPERFNLLTADSCSYPGVLIAPWGGSLANFSAKTRNVSFQSPADPESLLQIAVAFLVPKDEINLPLRIKLDLDNPVAVIEKKVKSPLILP
jgi:hypothetical protein